MRVWFSMTYFVFAKFLKRFKNFAEEDKYILLQHCNISKIIYFC